MSTPVHLSDRIGAACGAAYVLLILVGNQVATGGGENPHPSGASDLADFATTPTAVQTIGFTMELTGFLVLIPFLGWLVHAVRLRGGSASWLPGAAGIAGVIALAVKMASAMPILAGQIDHGDLTPAMARVLTDMNGAAFIVSFLPFGMFIALSGAAFLTSGFLGRVAGWAGVVIGVLTVLAPLATQADPVNTNPMPFVAGLLWLLVIAVRLAWKGARPAPERLAEPASPVMA